MTERWQQWMPFHIDRFRGSPDVQAMHPIARLGYIMLLASAWQTHDCALDNDPEVLSIASSLGDELWAIHAPRILRKFAMVDGKLRNDVLFKEWSEAKRIYEKRSESAMRTNSIRSRSPFVETVTDTVTDTFNGRSPSWSPSGHRHAEPTHEH